MSAFLARSCQRCRADDSRRVQRWANLEAIRRDLIRPEQIPLSALEELLAAMTQATGELFGYVEMWEATKKAKLEAPAA